ncbi:MAG: twin-arginine translocation signal domain-containing protein, partial [Chloroflexota bacterium]
MNRRKFLRNVAVSGAAAAVFTPAVFDVEQAGAAAASPPAYPNLLKRKITHGDRKAAAKSRAKAYGSKNPKFKSHAAQLTAPVPGGTPDYFGAYPNYANSPIIQKFIDPLPGLGAGPDPAGYDPKTAVKYIPVAVADTAKYPGSDYYEIALIEYDDRFHSKLGLTKLRGYVQTNNPADLNPNGHYLGPIIVANRDRPVRIKFTNKLATGAGGNLFIPVDTSVMGAGMGPATANYTQNRATLHLHGGNTAWISDGTAHQWTTPVGETTSYPKGVTVKDVPDMPATGVGELTFYYTNQQSARLMFYHDHAYGITRLNVYAGEAAGYVLTDTYEQDMITKGILPDIGVPLVIQDKTFIDPDKITAQDPTWPFTVDPKRSDLWFPHVYMPNQNPYDVTGTNPMGRWDYGPWFWPPFTGITTGTITNPFYDPSGTTPWEPPVCPGIPNPTIVPESFMDTPIVNGQAYPYLNIEPKAYRLRILNACNDRTLNLQLYKANSGIVGSLTFDPTTVTTVPYTDPTTNTTVQLTGSGSGYLYAPGVTLTGGGGRGATAVATTNAAGQVDSISIMTVGSGYTSAPTVTIDPPALTGGSGTTAAATATIYTAPTEVGMLPATNPGSWPGDWPTRDGRDGGFPDPTTRGPSMVHIGTEGGLMPTPYTISNRPLGFDYNRRSVTVLNVLETALFLGPAERADVIVDFTNYAGQTVILYNDGPTPVPAFDPRYDYYTGAPDNTSTGGAPTTAPGFGPNTRTILQINVASATTTPPTYTFDLGKLTTALATAFAASQDKILVPQTAYNTTYGGNFTNAYVRIQDTSTTFQNGLYGIQSIALTAGGSGYTSVPNVTIADPPLAGGTKAKASATLSAITLSGLTVTNAGAGYKTTPIVTIAPPHTPAITGDVTATATAVLAPIAVNNLTLTNGGSGYTTVPNVTIAAPTTTGGTTATATANLSPIGVSAIAVGNSGRGYTTAPTVTIAAPPAGGTQAVATATISGGKVNKITVTTAGAGYTTAPAVTLSAAPAGGTTATATATLTPASVASLTLTNPGSGYTAAPKVTITAPTKGTTATATATLTLASVASLTLTKAGAGYTTVPLVTIAAPPAGTGSITA